jgi:general secretion pathway protein G
MLKRDGFTLIELIIVIAVISILIGIALPRFRGMQEEGKIAQAKGELRTLQTAVESYYVHNSEALPANLAALTSAVPNIIGAALPTDPFNSGNNYVYATDGATPAKYYVIYSAGAATTAGVAAVSAAGAVTESAGNPIYVTNGTPRDSSP